MGSQPIDGSLVHVSAYVGSDSRRLQGLTSVALSQSGPAIILHTSDDVIGPYVRRESVYEQEESAWRLAFLGHPQRAHSVIEIGTNVDRTTIPLHF